MGVSIDVYDHNFEQEVLEKSYETPVLVDFFATWCGPCQLLKPILTQVAAEYDCIVAKVDIDANSYLASTYGVEGVPDVRVFRNGEVLDKFVGVLPEPELKAFLANCQIRSYLEEGLAAFDRAKAAGKLDLAEQVLSQLQEFFPDRPEVLLTAAQFFIKTDRPELAEPLLAKIRESDREYYPRSQAVKALVEFQREADQPVGTGELDRLYAQACGAVVEERYAEALDAFLEIVRRDRKFRNDGARKAMIAVFDLLGNDNPLTAEYRKQLMLTLY
jgi:putative thioredoxin